MAWRPNCSEAPARHGSRRPRQNGTGCSMDAAHSIGLESRIRADQHPLPNEPRIDFLRGNGASARCYRKRDSRCHIPELRQFCRWRCWSFSLLLPGRELAAVIIVDGLDEASGWEMERALLQSPPDSTVHIVVSARTLAGDRGNWLDWLHRLDWSQNSAQSIRVPPLSREGIGEALRSMGYPVEQLSQRGLTSSEYWSA